MSTKTFKSTLAKRNLPDVQSRKTMAKEQLQNQGITQEERLNIIQEERFEEVHDIERGNTITNEGKKELGDTSDTDSSIDSGYIGSPASTYNADDAAAIKISRSLESGSKAEDVVKEDKHPKRRRYKSSTSLSYYLLSASSSSQERAPRRQKMKERKPALQMRPAVVQDRLGMMEGQRGKQEMEIEHKLTEQNKAKDDELLQKKLTFIHLRQRESESTLSVDTVARETKTEEKIEGTPAKGEVRRESSASSSSFSECDLENKNMNTPFWQGVASLESDEEEKETSEALSLASTDTSSTSARFTVKYKQTSAIQPMKTITEEEKAKKARRETTLSAPSFASTSNCECKHAINKLPELQQKVVTSSMESPVVRQSSETVKMIQQKQKRASSSSSDPSSDSRSTSENDEDNTKVEEIVKKEEENKSVPQQAEVELDRRCFLSSSVISQASSDKDFRRPEKTEDKERTKTELKVEAQREMKLSSSLSSPSATLRYSASVTRSEFRPPDTTIQGETRKYSTTMCDTGISHSQKEFKPAKKHETPASIGGIRQKEMIILGKTFLKPETTSESTWIMKSNYKAGDAVEIYKYREDDEELDPFLCSGKVKNIKKLIESGRLPGQRILDEMCQIFGRKSKAIIVTCKAICEYIKSKHVAIAYVWAAYTIVNPQRITFVITVKHNSEGNKSEEPVHLEKLIQYSFVKQYVGDFSLEGSEVIKQQASYTPKLDEESYENLQNCISKHSEDLMKKHKYLSIISACSNRSKGFGASWELLPEKCIVLFVQKKNYIPIDEEPFKTNYDGIPVDVREGAFIPYGRTAGEKLDPARMGCQIGGDSSSGTLGCFIDHPQYGVCGLTCAHVLLHSFELERLKSHGMMKWPLHGMSKNVYQPADNQSVLGNIVQLICKKGSSNTCGMDVALFRITDRQPKTASFPDATAISGSSFQTINYDSWRMCGTGMLNLTQDRVVKFGSTTELRDGKIIFDAMGVKELESCPLLSGCATITLFNQIEVKDHTQGFCFADRGDSGALVFVDDNNSQHTCIGIVEGGTTYGTVVVTPIVPILEELNVPCLKSFETETNLSHIHDNINNLQGEMQTVRQDIQNINRNLQDVRSSIQDVQTQSSTIQRIEQLLLNRR